MPPIISPLAISPLKRRGGINWSSYWATLNVVIEGHSFVAPASYFEDYLCEVVPSASFYNSAVGGSLVSDCESRAAVVDSKLVTGSPNRNILFLWIGVNSMVNEVGMGTTRYNEVKSYVDDRVAAGWRVFVFTMTSSTSGGRAAQFEIERDIFNGLLRSELSLNNSVYLLDTDTLSELDDPSDTVYYLDTIHLTAYGYYFVINELVGAKLSEIDVSYTAPAEPTVTATELTVTPSGTNVNAVRFTLRSNTKIVYLHLSGAAKFYIDAACTLGERSLLAIAPGDYNKELYLKCPTNPATLKISNEDLVYWDWYDNENNGASVGGDICDVTALQNIIVQTYNTLSGDISKLANLIYLNIRGANTLSGSVAALTKLTHLENRSESNTLTGSVTSLTLLDYIDVRGNNTLSGSVASLTKLTRLYVTGTNTLSGIITNLVDLTLLYVTGTNTR